MALKPTFLSASRWTGYSASAARTEPAGGGSCISLFQSRIVHRNIVPERFADWEEHMAKLMSKSELIQKIADQHSNGLTRKDIKGVLESLASVGYKELKKTGAFFVPGFAKFVVIKKPATKQRTGINPFTKEPTVFKAKPARKVIRARPVKAVKDAVA
jgi:DNA-binding protein HU-beta